VSDVTTSRPPASEPGAATRLPLERAFVIAHGWYWRTAVGHHGRNLRLPEPAAGRQTTHPMGGLHRQALKCVRSAAVRRSDPPMSPQRATSPDPALPLSAVRRPSSSRPCRRGDRRGGAEGSLTPTQPSSPVQPPPDAPWLTPSEKSPYRDARRSRCSRRTQQKPVTATRWPPRTAVQAAPQPLPRSTDRRRQPRRRPARR